MICDKMPVRTVEDLRENFAVEDVLKYYENGLLHRWLEVRGYTEELRSVKEIKPGDSIEIIKEIIKIFNVETEPNKIAESVYMLEFLREDRYLCEQYKENKFRAAAIIDDYQAGYDQLVSEILDNPDDVSRIKANLELMASNYKWALDLNHRELFLNLRKKSLLAVMCLLMNDKTREYYLPVEIVNDDGFESLTEGNKKKVYDIELNTDKRMMYNAICQMPEESNFATVLGENLHVFSGVTDGYWKDLEPKGKKFMIISMGAGDYVRSAGVIGGDMSSSDVNKSFVIVDGIDYKSNSASRQLRYMEV